MKLDNLKIGMKVKIKPNWKEIMTKVAENNNVSFSFDPESKSRGIYDKKDIESIDFFMGKEVTVDTIDSWDREYLSVGLEEVGVFINHKCLKSLKNS